MNNHSEDGREVPEVVAHLNIPRKGSLAGAKFVNVGPVPEGRSFKDFDIVPLMTVAQHSRIVAALDAEIAHAKLVADELGRIVDQLRSQPAGHSRTPEHSAYEAQRCALAKLLGAFLDAPKDTDQAAAFTCAEELFNATTGILLKDSAQHASQVGGDEREAFEAWAKSNRWFRNETSTHRAFHYTDDTTQDHWAGWQARAALAPAAVVMPDHKTCDDAPWMSADTEPDIAWRDGYNAAIDEAKSIPASLLRLIVSGNECAREIDELRALLGKDE